MFVRSLVRVGSSCSLCSVRFGSGLDEERQRENGEREREGRKRERGEEERRGEGIGNKREDEKDFKSGRKGGH